jgi:diphthine synthase
MFYLIGSGLWRGDDISVRGMNACRKCSKVYLDRYTRAFEEKEFKKLEEIIGKKIIKLERKELEETLSFLKESENENICLIVPGDPLIATTHVTIIEECKKRKIEYEIIHGSSIFTALPGECGLMTYKVGGSCTIPMREKRIIPYSIYDKIFENKKRGYHTLVFLDTTPEKEMEISEAMEIMQEIEKEKKLKIFNDKSKIVVGSCMGSEEQRLVYNEIKELKKMKFEKPCTLIIPGKLHFSEEEFLEKLKG